MPFEQPMVPESVYHLAEIWSKLELDEKAFEIAQLRYGSTHLETIEIMGAIGTLEVSEVEKSEMKAMLGLVSLSDLPMSEDEIIHLIDTDLAKARRILDIVYAFKAKSKQIS